MAGRLTAKVATDAPTYFAGAFGVSSLHVEAGARASCGASNGACNLFPTAFSEEIWNAATEWALQPEFLRLEQRCGQWHRPESRLRPVRL